MKRALASLILASLLMTTLPLNVSADETEDIPTNAAATGFHDSLVAALAHADLVTTLQGTGPFTVFAPTDDAFAAAGINLADFDTAEENATLSDILLYHVYSGAVASSDVTDGLTVSMVNGDDATFTVATDGTVMIGDATVTTADVQASNGVIHVIDKVLMPPVDLVDIPTVATSTGVHTALVAALSQAGLVETLQGAGPFTVFAPTDAAFTAAGIDLSELTTEAGLATLTDILLYHVYSGAVASSDVTDGLTVSMVNGDDATFTVATDGTVMIGDATVTTADVQASNGVIHVIDKVLMPPAGEICYNTNTHMIVAGADKATCGAFMYLENYTMNGQEITGCYNSITHAVSNVSQAVCESYMWTPSVDIAMTAGATGIHTSLVAALAKANLVATLQGDGPFTVFAPSDAAFTAAGINLDDFTTDAQIAALADILLFHVVSGQVNAADVTDGLVAAAVNGDNLTFVVANGTVTVNGATVILADVPASNGVIHVIDAVLMPPTDVVEPVLPDCDITVTIAPSGLKFSPSEITVAVGETVCWQWTDESMAHNVREVDGDKSTTYAVDGVTSGAANVTVDFRHTFDVDSTSFYYACEPHLASGMFGKVIVGDGGAVVVPTPDDDGDMDSDEESVPGFLGVMATVALAGAAFVSSRREE
jgi:transforming growth factor-beta-induced protein